MKFSVNWLREFVELPASVDELAELLTMAGVEIEAIEKRGGAFENIVVAQIRESKQHPNADRLSVCTVDDGSGSMHQIVCGAKNYKAGDKVPLALPGAHLPNGLDIKKSKLRGVESEGMLCSPIEIGLGEDASGLLILSPDAPVGAPLAQLFPADTIFDVEITPNRPDLLSHFGLAREISALTGKKLVELSPVADLSAATGVHISAIVECPFYSARRIDNVQVGPSPDWLRAKIESVGIRSINNVVDITNFVMLELGQPLHAFDADKLSGAINVRLADEGEKFLALDGRTYSLGPENLVIADQKRAVAIGGVMGGEDSGVTASTRNVLLEAAYFLPTSVRRTARKLNLPSDSSYRFERGVDPGMVLRASQRATELITQLAHGAPQQSIATAGELPLDPANLALRYAHANRVIGTRIEHDRINDFLRRFGLVEVGHAGETETWWRIPSYRRDLRREEDLIEEIVRGFGVNNIPSASRSSFTPASEADMRFDFEMQLRERLIACGFFEAKTSVLLPRGTRCAFELRNPLSEDHVGLRPSLLPGLLGVVERNVRSGAASIRLFEIGRVFRGDEVRESRSLGFVLHGNAKSQSHWRASAARRLDMFDAKGAIEALGLREVTFRKAERPEFALYAEVVLRNEVIGMIGQSTAANAPVAGSVIVAQIELESLFTSPRSVKYAEVDRFPPVSRDIAMILPEKSQHAEIERVIHSAKEPLLADVQLFDLFSANAEQLGAGRKSMAYTLTYRDKNRTLTHDEVTVVHNRIRERLQRELGAELRE
ncbi:MAG: phenylalanine--tRNA ligase subunit beta [Chthoniobacterales bacterium]